MATSFENFQDGHIAVVSGRLAIDTSLQQPTRIAEKIQPPSENTVSVTFGRGGGAKMADNPDHPDRKSVV